MVEARETEKGDNLLTPSVVHHRSQKTTPQCTWRVDLPSPLGFDTFVQNLKTLVRTVAERVFYVRRNGVHVPPPQPLPNSISLTLEDFRSRLQEQRTLHGPVARWSAAKVVRHYTGRKRMRYEQAAADYYRHGFRKACSYVRGFLKWEKICSSPWIKPWSDRICRLISPRTPLYNLVVGRYLLAAEKPVFEMIDRVYDSLRPTGEVWPTIMKGLNAQDSGNIIASKFSRFKNPVVVMMDATRWDQHVSKQCLKWEHCIYLMLFGGSKERRELRRLLKWQLFNKVTAQARGGHVKFGLSGGRMSGDINTSMGNCLLMSALTFAYITTSGVTNAEVCNNGDDTFVIMEATDLTKLPVEEGRRWWTARGFTMDFEGIARRMEDIKFCQCRPVWTGSTWLMVRDVDPVLSKDIISLKPLPTPRLRAAYLWSIATGGLATYGGVPVLDSFYKCLLRGSQMYSENEALFVKYKPYFDVDRFNRDALEKGMNRRGMKITEEARASFAIAFGIAPELQKAMEDKYARYTIDPFSVTPAI